MKIVDPAIPAHLSAPSDPIKTLKSDTVLQELLFDACEFSDINVRSLSIKESRFHKVNFYKARLEKLDFTNVELCNCELTAANCDEASWRRVTVKSSRSSGIILTNGTLEDIVFNNCKLDLANFRYCKLKNVLFQNCHLRGADFYHATLTHVVFENCELKEVEFSQSELTDVDLRTSDILEIKSITSLKGTTISDIQLMQIAPALANGLGIKVEG